MPTQDGSDRIADSILASIRTHVEGDPDAVTLDTQLADLGIHSLELTEIIFDVEDAFGIEVDMSTVEAWENLGTVRDIVDAVRKLVDAKT